MSATDVTLEAQSDKSDIRLSSCSASITKDGFPCTKQNPLDLLVTALHCKPTYIIKLGITGPLVDQLSHQR